MDPILDGLNQEQYQAVTHTDGPLLVLAGAGSGKTRVITHRFAYLLREKGLYLQNILAVTFTNKAANEMKQRIEQLTGQNVRTAWIRTFHSMGVMLMRRHADLLGYDRNFVIYDDVDTRNIIKGIMKEFKINTEQYPPKVIASIISKEKDKLVDPQMFSEKAVSDVHKEAAKVYELYEKRLKKNNAIDFADLIALQVKLFRAYPEVRNDYQKRWRYVMIDEFQDTNSAQYELVKLIVNSDRNICVVGDDDQSIYGWRGADIENIYDFKNSFQPKLIALEQNYRSTSIILEAANQIVSLIPNRLEKKLWTQQKKREKIRIIDTYTDREEAAAIVSEIKRLLSHYHYRDFAVFYRTNAQSRVLEEALLRRRIPYKVFGGQKFYERKEIKDILAYLKLIVNPMDSIAFDRVVNVPKRKVGQQSKEKILNYSEEFGLNYMESLMRCDEISGLQKGVKTALKDLGLILQELHENLEKISPVNFVKILLDAIEYREYILKYDSDGQDRWSNVEELINSVRNFQDFHQDATIVDFLNEISLETSSDSLDGEDQRNYVSLMTIHNAKGLEFPVVFISGVVEGLIPLMRTEEKDEERRLFYVAITRAKEKLFISYSSTRMKFGDFMDAEPSSFLSDISEELMEFSGFDKEEPFSETGKTNNHKTTKTNKEVKKEHPKGTRISSVSELTVGDQIEHSLFGVGKVIFVSERILKVVFDKVGAQIFNPNQVSDLMKL